jgi:hypothetical protein
MSIFRSRFAFVLLLLFSQADFMIHGREHQLRQRHARELKKTGGAEKKPKAPKKVKGTAGGGNTSGGGDRNGTTGSMLVEKQQCMAPTHPLVIDSQSRTSGSCQALSCGGGCCRYHTAFLICDTKNLYPHQPCVCNADTNNNAGAITGL